MSKTRTETKIPDDLQFTAQHMDLTTRHDLETRKTHHQRLFKLQALRDAKHIDDATHFAGLRFKADYEIGVEGYREGGEMPPEVRTRSSPGGYTDTQLDAGKRYRDATKAVGLMGSRVLEMLVILDITPNAIGKEFNWQNQYAQGYVVSTLVRLAEHYEAVDAKPVGMR